jgi:hypothetical protein
VTVGEGVPTIFERVQKTNFDEICVFFREMKYVLCGTIKDVSIEHFSILTATQKQSMILINGT